MWELWDKRLLLVSGKGGVGKSTLAAALALAAHRQGRRVLVAEVDTRPVMPFLLSERTAAASAGSRPARPAHLAQGGEPEALEDGLAAVNLDHTSSVVSYLQEHLPIPRLLRSVVGNPVIRSFLRAAPSVTEMAVLSRILVWVRDIEHERVPYDLLVVDLPALGHAFQMLKVPGLISELVHIGPVAERARAVLDMLLDARRTALVLVSLAEELPVTETIQLGQRIHREVGVAVQHLLVNQVTLPLLPDGAPTRLLLQRLAAATAVRAAGPLDTLLAQGGLRETRARRSREQVDRLNLEFPGVPLHQLPQLTGESAGVRLVQALSHLLPGGTRG